MAKRTHDPDEYRMSFGEHLEELRKCMIRALVGIGAVAVFTFIFGRDIIGILVEPLNRVQIDAGIPPTTITRTPMGGFNSWVKVSLISAAILAAPWVAYQVWLFISAGLYDHERRVVRKLVPFSAVMTLLGVLFAYYIILPVSLTFLLFFSVNFGPPGGESEGVFKFLSDATKSWTGGDDADAQDADKTDADDQSSADDMTATLERVPQLEADPPHPKPGQIWVNTTQNALKIRVGDRTMIAQLSVSALVSPLIELSDYINFALWIMLGIVVAFQVPVLMVVGGAAGVLDPDFLARSRKYIIFICFVLGAVLTPADPISMFVLAVPLWVLFEFGLFLIRGMRKKKAAAEAAESSGAKNGGE